MLGISGGGRAFRLPRWASLEGDPSLRLKNGFAQDDAFLEGVTALCWKTTYSLEPCRVLLMVLRLRWSVLIFDLH